MSNSKKVAIVGKGERSSLPLSEDQLSAFWDGILRHRDAARRMAGKFVPRQDVDDVVDTAMVRFVEALERPNEAIPFPADDDAFRRFFLVVVRNHAINCARSDTPECPVHSQWGTVLEPVVAGNSAGDRPLDHVFAGNDDGKYDAPVPGERRAEDDVQQLREILRSHVVDLPSMQRQIIEAIAFDGRKRAAVAASLAISVKTYDCHFQAALCSLRDSLSDDALAFTGMSRSLWYDVIEELRECYDAKRVLRPSGKKGNRSTSAGDRSKSEGDRGKNLGSAAA